MFPAQVVGRLLYNDVTGPTKKQFPHFQPQDDPSVEISSAISQLAVVGRLACSKAG